MKRNYLLLFVTLLACNQKTDPEADIKNSNGSYKYDISKNEFSDFIVQTPDERVKKPYLVTYGFKGVLKNNTSDIYEKAFVTLETVIVLKNGNQLSCNDLSYTKDLIGSGVFATIEHNWKPNGVWEIDEAKSCSISVDYFDYPIDKVYEQMYLEIKDQINQQEKKMLISQVDVTEKWRNAESKFRNNKSDCTSYHVGDFLKKK